MPVVRLSTTGRPNLVTALTALVDSYLRSATGTASGSNLVFARGILGAVLAARRRGRREACGFTALT